jgi:hypothetical protein
MAQVRDGFSPLGYFPSAFHEAFIHILWQEIPIRAIGAPTVKRIGGNLKHCHGFCLTLAAPIFQIGFAVSEAPGYNGSRSGDFLSPAKIMRTTLNFIGIHGLASRRLGAGLSTGMAIR